MADEEKEKEEKKEGSREAGSQKQDEPEQKGSDKKTSTKGYLKWIVLAVVVVICAGAGFGLGRLFGRSSTGGIEETSQQTEPDQAQPIKVVASQKGSKGTWYYNFEPVVANLNEPGATRYIRAALTLQISTALDSQTGTTFLEEKKPILRNWLTIYLAGQTIEETRGDRNLRRIQSEILDAFNEKLFPDSKPLIKSVFFKDFAIQ
jgi:flagellar basal body-associated protein FliL